MRKSGVIGEASERTPANLYSVGVVIEVVIATTPYEHLTDEDIALAISNETKHNGLLSVTKKRVKKIVKVVDLAKDWRYSNPWSTKSAIKMIGDMTVEQLLGLYHK